MGYDEDWNGDGIGMYLVYYLFIHHIIWLHDDYHHVQQPYDIIFIFYYGSVELLGLMDRRCNSDRSCHQKHGHHHQQR